MFSSIEANFCALMYKKLSDLYPQIFYWKDKKAKYYNVKIT